MFCVIMRTNKRRKFFYILRIENIDMEVYLMRVIGDDCIKCGSCAAVCPVSAISEGDVKYVIAETCIDCGSCEPVCPVGTIHPAE